MRDAGLTEEKWQGLVARPRFEEYAEKYKDSFVMRRENGVIELRMHTKGGPYYQTMAGHNSWSQAWLDVGNDPDNQVLILTGTGDQWVDSTGHGDPDYFRQNFGWERTSRDIAKLNFDARKLLENLVFNVDIPTIAAVNGPGPHTEIALACDLTLCTNVARFFDPHFFVSTAPGDGQGLAFQEVLGTKRAAYHMYTSKPIDAQQALAYGMVSEVVSREALLPRAWELAEMIMRRPPTTREMTHAIVSRPWKQRLVNDFGFHHKHQSFASFTSKGHARTVPADGKTEENPF